MCFESTIPFNGSTYEGTVTRNGQSQKIRVIADQHDPDIHGTGPGVITTGIPIK